MNGGILTLFLKRELRDIRGNARVWPLYLVLPVLGIGLPVLFALLAPLWVGAGRTEREAQIVINLVQRMPEFSGLPPTEAVARFLLRNTAGFFLLIPVALASTSAAFSIVGEKTQRTLEPILATPITDRQFLVAKLLAAAGPTIAVTVIVSLATIVIVDAITVGRYGTLLLPDRFWLLGTMVLSPLVAIAVALVTMRLSAKATDPQAAVQITALFVIPAFLLVIGVFGRLLTMFFPALVGACVLVAFIDLALFQINVRRFRREEILTRWA
jgi:ABC-2 type transport system permease protein